MLEVHCIECLSDDIVDGRWHANYHRAGVFHYFFWTGYRCRVCGAGQPAPGEIMTNPGLAMIAIELREIRIGLGLSTEDANEVFSEGDVEYKGYEEGSYLPPELTIKVMRLLVTQPELLDEFRSA